MSHAPKIVSLAAVLLIFQSGISLAGPPDPTKQISPSLGRPIVAAKLPDLVLWKAGGGIGVTNFSCTKFGGTWVLKILFGVKNIGTVKTTVPFNVLVKVNEIGRAHV